MLFRSPSVVENLDDAAGRGRERIGAHGQGRDGGSGGVHPEPFWLCRGFLPGNWPLRNPRKPGKAMKKPDDPITKTTKKAADLTGQRPESVSATRQRLRPSRISISSLSVEEGSGGAAGAAASAFFRLFIALTTMNSTKAMMMKLIETVMNLP